MDPYQRSGKNNFSLKQGGKKLPGQAAGQANIFALAASTSQRQDRSYYKSLYNFNADVELAEYSLPVLSSQQPYQGQKGGPGAAISGYQGSHQSRQGKASSGVINATHLPPLNQGAASQGSRGRHGGYPNGIPEEAMDQQTDDMEMLDGEGMDQQYGMEEDGQGDDSNAYVQVQYSDIRGVIERKEDKAKDQVVEAREAHYISKGTYIYQLLSQIETGEQAISFFAKHGHNTPIKFVNCKRKPVPKDQYRPYDLVKIDEEIKELDGDYFTISAQGVVQISIEKSKNYHKKVAEPTEFLSLSEWMQQSTMFNVLTSMKFFKHYLIGKVFQLWMNNVRFKKYNRTRKMLSNNLIFGRPAFLSTYMQINQSLFEMQQKKTFVIPQNGKNFEINEFSTEQKSQRDNVIKPHYTEKVDEIINKRLGELVTIVSASRTLKEDEDLEHSKTSQPAKHKSMVLQKKEDELKTRVLNHALKNFKSLGTFIRLVDYMVVETQVKINQESADLILSEMQKESKKYGIQTTVSYAVEGMTFEPAKSEFITQFDKILQDMQSVTDDVSRVISHPDFHQHIQGLINENGPKFRTIVDQSEAYAASKSKIAATITQDFEQLQSGVKKFLECRDIDEFDRTFIFEDFIEEEKRLRPNAIPDTIKQKLGQLQQWDQLIQKNIKPLESGLITVQSRRLALRLSQKVKDESLNYRKYLITLSDQKYKEIQAKISEIKATLTKTPNSLQSYVDFVRQLQWCKEMKENLDGQKRKLEEMKGVYSKYKKTDDTTQSNQQTTQLQTKIETTQTGILDIDGLIVKAEEEIINSKQGFVEELEQKIIGEQGKIQTFIDELTSPDGIFVSAQTKTKTATDDLSKLKKKFDESVRRVTQFNNYQETLNLPTNEIPETAIFSDKFQIREGIWTIRRDFADASNRWFEDSWVDQNANSIVSTVQEKTQALNKLGQRLNLPAGEEDEVLIKAKMEVKEVKDQTNLIQSLGVKALDDKHWTEIWNLVGFQQEKDFSYNQLKAAGITQYAEKVEGIAAFASGERTILETINDIAKQWEDYNFVVKNYRDTKDRFYITEVDELIALLEDHQMTIQTSMGSKYVAEIRGQVSKWEENLSYISDTLDEWLIFQKTWMYLENIFNSDDIVKQLPTEAASFKQVDKFWKETMQKTKRTPRVMEVPENTLLCQRFQQNNAMLEEIQKSLENYLETKRTAFPRFYFLSNDELLEILSQTRNAQAVQPHLRKCFDSIVKVEFNSQKGKQTEILGMLSPEQEIVNFSEVVIAQGPVETWLTNIENMMRKTLYDNTKGSLEEYPKDASNRSIWYFLRPAMCILTIDQVEWTKGVTSAIEEIMKGKDKKALEVFLAFSIVQITGMVDLVRGELNKQQRSLLVALIVIDVHARDVIKNMIRTRVDNLNDFEWTRQLRYYWEQEGEEWDAFAKQTNTRFRYGYEYLGNGPRLVITPLTDKCYMTLTGALHLNFGGAPQGPAGTGKTETTKDLAKALAIQCVVFNCSDGLDFKTMARFFSGLAQGGAWACFDEFNRIDIEVLSVIAQQILTIQSAIRQKLAIFTFNDREMKLNLGFGVFITMNPGYAGRTELPDNLKALFRPVAMMIPDYKLIAQIILYSEGFVTADELARKMVRLYSLSSEQLSKQDHYDFGMRAVKSVLVMAGALRRQDTSGLENTVLIRAMRDSNVPKFLEHDLPLFEGIVNDLFPGVKVDFVDYGDLQRAIENQLRIQHFQVVPGYVKKIIQLLETMMVRHGIMLVGATGVGKTNCSQTLGRALGQLFKDGSKDPWHKSVHIDALNPKSVTMGELFGETNLMTNEWTEGLVSKLVKDAVAALEGDKPDQKRWINFDGPVDALWIENMNTVLDDNKMLCLANGQRIKMPEICTMMFEVQDLRVASPATVSRCGMVYMEQVHLGWEPLIQTWHERRTEDIQNEKIKTMTQEQLDFIIETIMPVCQIMIPFIRQECKETVPSVDSNLIRGLLNLIDSFLCRDLGAVEVKKAAYPNKVMLTYLSFSLIWSLGANIQDDSRSNFADELRPLIKKKFMDFPDKGDVYDFGIDPENHKLEPWKQQVPGFKYNPEASFFEILVPTSDTVKYKYLLSTLLGAGHNVLITGGTGVGKSVVTKGFLATAPEDIVSACVNFSGKTTTKNLQDAFEGNLDAKRKTLLGPPAGKSMIFFIDDVNMPQLDRYGSQPPCELLRQTIDTTGFYDTKKLIFKQIQNTRFVCACAPPGGGRNAVTPRLLRHFNMIWVPELSEDSMKTIFTQILGGFLGTSKINSDLSKISIPIIEAAVELYLQTSKDFLPTPAKCHYTFNLRDLSKVVQGILMMPINIIEENNTVITLWLHETFRVFRDRLIDPTDRSKFSKLIHEKQKNWLQTEWELDSYENILFGKFEDNSGNYRRLSEINALIPRLDIQLDLYNSENSPMNLVFFSDCIQHLSRIARILSQKRGNAMLVGVGGSGRRSMARLAASMNEMKPFSIEITKSYREKEFQEDIRQLLKRCGLENKSIVFLFSDTQIVKESFLEDINNLLNSGEIPNLFPQDEKSSICDEIRPAAEKVNQADSRDMLYAYFVQICRENLHIVLAFSPVGDQFRNRCRQFPSIINCCTIDWYDPWPAEALYSVAHRQYAAQEHQLGITQHLDALCQTSVEIHLSVSKASDKFYNELRRRNYTTPTSYLDLVKTYKEMLGYQRGIVPKKIQTYQGGLIRLTETNKLVAELEKNLVLLAPEIEVKEKDTQLLVVDLQARQSVANEQEKIAAKDEADLKKQADAVNAIKQECEEELSKAMPIYREALKALDTLKPEDIGEMKAYANPKPEIITVVCSVCCLLKEKEDWATGKQLMNKPKEFIETLKSYDKDNIPEALLKKLKKNYTSREDFQPEIVKKFSAAAESLCKWARALENYSEVLKVIKPKQAALKQAETEKAVADEAVAIKRKALQAIRDEVASLQRNYDKSMRLLEDLNKKKETIQEQLVRAAKLVVGLADEAKRWQETVKVLEVDLINLVGNIMLAAGYISYVGPFTAIYREQLLSQWKKVAIAKGIPFSSNFTVERILGDPVQIREWNIQGLPADNLSIENGIICTQAKRWPLLIDPQSQGNKWIKSKEKDSNIQCTKLSNPTFLKTVENSIRIGNPVLIENIDETLDPSLEPVLTKNIVKKNGNWIIRLGDTDVVYNNDFNFIITTKLANPHYLPEICIKVTLINFTVTPDGLEDQLLVDVVKYEQPELETTKDALVVMLSDFKNQLQQIEDKILKLVSEADEKILDDVALIETLDRSKQTSIQIEEKMFDAEITAKRINETRESYRGIARRGSVLYFVIADLALIDPMYQYSLEFFTRLFNRRLDKSKKSTNLEERIKILLEDVTESFYLNICRGLFEKDKLIYSFLNAASISKRAGEISASEWNCYLRGSLNDYSKEKYDVTCVPENTFYKLFALQDCNPNFEGLVASFRNSQDVATCWRKWGSSDEPQKIQLPDQLEYKLTPFQKLMLLKVIREEKLSFGIKKYVGQELGPRFIESPPFDLEGALTDSLNATPIIFVLSPGADPIADLIALANAKGMGKKIKILSLGQGQGPTAQAYITEGQTTGAWVCLQNCHLSASWMPELEKIQERQDENLMHSDYRLWLTSMPSLNFPVPVLQSGIKLTNEPPRGLKANLKRTYADIGEEEFNGCSKPKEFKKLLFALAYFHAAILERRKYGSIGWNIPYEWMTSDLEISKRQLRMYLDEQDAVPYVTFRYLVADANYGGRVTDDKDSLCIRAMLTRYFCPELMNDNYRLAKLDMYYAPPEGSLAATKTYIESLPLDEDPEVFGLHPNANIVYEQKTSAYFSETVLLLQPRVAAGGGAKTPDEIAQDLCREIASRLPAFLDTAKAHPSTFTKTPTGQPASLGVFVGQEIDRFNTLLSVMRRTLDQLDKAIEGTVVMSMELEGVMGRFLDGKVPEPWENAGYPSLKPLASWVNDLIARVSFISKWLYGGFPDSYWVSAFFFPQGFMTASLQAYARKTQTAIDGLQFKTNVKSYGADNVKEVPTDGVNIHGLYLQGARWDYNRSSVDDSEPRVPIIQFPLIWLEPVDVEVKIDTGCYNCPLYKTSTRRGELSTTGHSTNFVLFLSLPSELPPDYWIRRGAALLCMTDD